MSPPSAFHGSVHESNNRRSDACWVAEDVGFPDTNHPPPEPRECAGNLTIAGSIARDLLGPVGSIGASGQLGPSSRPVLAVPKVAITEDRHLGLENDEVRVTD